MDATEAVRKALVEAFTSGRQRVAKPVVLPVVDRKGHANAPDLVVEDLELCSEQDHPHGQGWVPIRIMYSPDTATAASPESQGDVSKVPLMTGQTLQTAMQYNDSTDSSPSKLPAGIAAALRTTMQITDSSKAAAFKVAIPGQADVTSVQEHNEQDVEQHTLPGSKDLLSQAELDELALAGRTHTQEVATQAAHSLLNDTTAGKQSQPLLLPPQQPLNNHPGSDVTPHDTQQQGVTEGVSISWQQLHEQQQSGAEQLQGSGIQNVCETRRRPVVILLHSTGSDMGRMRSEQEACARVGYLAVTMDCRYHGYRCVVEHEGQHKREVYQQALVRAWRSHGKERPFLLDNLWDLSHLLDYLVTRPDVDPTRIGMTGVSLGGMHAWLMAAADPRVAVAAPMIGVQNFHWAIRHNQWHARVDSVPAVFAAAAQDLGKPCVDSEVVAAVWDRIAPGLIGAYDSPCSLAAIYPRPLLIVNGELDMRCPMIGVHEAFQIAQQRYLEQHLKEQGYQLPAEALAKREKEAEALNSLTAAGGSNSNTDAGSQPGILSSAQYGDIQGDGDMPEVPLPAEVVQGDDVSNQNSGNLGEKYLQSCPGQTKACSAAVNDAEEQERNGIDTCVPHSYQKEGNDTCTALPEAPVDVYSKAVKAVNEKLILYVEPGAGHEEKPGMWKAVRLFLDLHLREVDTSTSTRNAVLMHSFPISELKQSNGTSS